MPSTGSRTSAPRRHFPLHEVVDGRRHAVRRRPRRPTPRPGWGTPGCGGRAPAGAPAAGRRRWPGRRPTRRPASPGRRARQRRRADVTAWSPARCVRRGHDHEPAAQERLAVELGQPGARGRRRPAAPAGAPASPRPWPGRRWPRPARPRAVNAVTRAGATNSAIVLVATTRSSSGAPWAWRMAASASAARFTICEAMPTSRWPPGVSSMPWDVAVDERIAEVLAQRGQRAGHRRLAHAQHLGRGLHRPEPGDQHERLELRERHGLTRVRFWAAIVSSAAIWALSGNIASEILPRRTGFDRAA